MIAPTAHPDDPHYLMRSGWLRAAVLGANDGIVSTSSLIVGVAAANPEPTAVLIAGVAGLAAGAMSMAAGEYVSVSSQSDIERADIARETQALKDSPKEELEELAAIYRERGLSDATAMQVARELTAKDALGAHVRDELGLSEIHVANPLQAALASGVTFCAAAAVPLVAAIFAPVGVHHSCRACRVRCHPRGARRDGSKGRRCASRARNPAGGHVGSFRHGGDSGRRQAVRHRSLTGVQFQSRKDGNPQRGFPSQTT